MFRNIIFSFSLLAVMGLSSSALGKADVYEIDPAHTSVVFKVNHLGFSNVYGQFPDVSGTFKIDEKKPENSSIDLKIKTASITTHNKKRDEHLRKPDFFNAKQYPVITFKSTQVKKLKDKTYKIDGKLNMHGKTKPVSFEFHRQRTGKDPWGKTRTGGDAELTIKRSDFGMNYMQGKNQLSDKVHLLLSVEGIKQEKE